MGSIMPLIAIIVAVVAIVCIPFAVAFERKRKREELLKILPIYAFLFPGGIAGEVEPEKVKQLKEHLISALESCDGGDLKRAAYHVENARRLFAVYHSFVVGPSVATMIMNDKMQKFCKLLWIAADLPPEIGPKALVRRLLVDAIERCDGLVSGHDKKAFIDCREKLIAKIKQQGDPNNRKEPDPIVSLEDFFEGNTDVDSMGSTLEYDHPKMLYRVLKDIRARKDVQDVLVAIHKLEEGIKTAWPVSKCVYILTSAPIKDVVQWVKPMKGWVVSEGWWYKMPANAPKLAERMRVYSASWF